MLDDPRKKRIQALLQLEDSLPALDYSVPTPAGQVRITRQPLDLDNLDVSAPVSSLGRSAGGMKPEELSTPPVFPAQGDTELDSAREEDANSRSDRLLETATRQLIGGITRTQPQATLTQQTSKEAQLLAQRKQAQMDALRQLEAGNNAARTKAYEAQSAATSQRADQKLAFDQAEAKAREERYAQQRAADAEKFAEQKRHNRSTEGAAWKNAERAQKTADLAEEKMDIKRDALKPRAGWEPIDPSGPTFRDPAQAKAFDDSVAAMGAIRNHRDHVLHELDALKAAKTPAEADIAAGRLNAQMGALASKLRAAEGLNNTDAANHAIETMLSLQNGSAINWKNVINEGRLPSIINAAIASGEANLDTIAESNNLRRAKTKGASPQATAGPVKMRFPDGSVHEVPPERVELAKRKGGVPNG